MPGEMTEETSEYQSEYMSRWVVITRIWIVTMKAQFLTKISSMDPILRVQPWAKFYLGIYLGKNRALRREQV